MTAADIRVTSGRPAALRNALADQIAELRSGDPLEPITVLVGTSLQRPHLARWLAARLGGHANVQILMPGDFALLLGAPDLVAATTTAAVPPASTAASATSASIFRLGLRFKRAM
jgi:hypothetical protein